MKNIIAIDYGERYVGLALKKQSINSAYAYKVLDSKSLDVLDEIKQSLIDHEIDEIVIGYPIGLNSHQTLSLIHISEPTRPY